MATDDGTIEFLMDQLGTRGATYSTKRMFGEYCLYRDGLPVALICDDILFVKDTADGREAIAAIAAVELGPPYPGARPHLRVAPDLWDDGDALRRLLDTTAAALPAPKVKKAPGVSRTPAAAKVPNASSKKAPSRGLKPAKPGSSTPTRARKRATPKPR